MGEFSPTRYQVPSRLLEVEAMGAKQFDLRLEAIKAGQVTYKGTPCVHGHEGIRYAATGQCVPCTKARAIARQRRIAEAVREARAQREAEE